MKNVVLLILLFLSITVVSQTIHDGTTFQLEESLVGSHMYNASSTIELNPGFDYIAADDEYLMLSINILTHADTIIGHLGNQTITIYPNPTGGAFAVGITNLSGVVKKSMALYTISGREIFKKQDFNELTEINISTQKSGTYILKILLDNKQTTWKIVKR